MSDHPRIMTQPVSERVTIIWQETRIADTTDALVLHERGYPPRLYLPLNDIAADTLCVSDTTTHCPFKGDTTYYHIHIDGQQLDDAAWRYAEPKTDLAEIADRVAFDHSALTIRQDTP